MTEGLLGQEHSLPYERANSQTQTEAPEPEQSEDDQGEPVEPVLEGDEPSNEEFEEGADPGGEDAGPAEDVFEIRGEKVNRAELEEGWLRQSDYTKKTQELAAQRKAHETARETELLQVRQARDQYAELLKRQLAETEPPAVDWEKLSPDQIGPHLKALQERQEKQRRFEQVEAERFADFQGQLRIRLATESEKLLEALPEWKDPVKADAAKAALVQYATTTYGFTPAELGNVLDHRYIAMAVKAMKYDAQQKTGKETLTEKTKGVKVLKPGGRDTSQTRPATNELQRLRDRARRSGSVEDAVALHQAERAAKTRQR